MPIISTFLLAKYNSIKPKNLEIKQHQFIDVYLPIYKILINDLEHNIDKETAIDYINKIKPILWDKYEFAYPQLHESFNNFCNAVKSNEDYQNLFNEICYQISLDYNFLKRSLGYPSESYLGLFNRMTFTDKLYQILGWINVILIFSPLILIFFIQIPFFKDNLLKIVIISYFIILFESLFLKPRNQIHY